MKLLFVILAFLAAMAVLLLVIYREGKKEVLSKSAGLNVWIIVKDQESWVEGFVRKLFRIVKDTNTLDVCIVDDGSCDRTPEILQRLERIYPFRLLQGVKGGYGGNCRCSADSGKAALYFDVRGLAGRELLNAPLFYHLTDLNEGNSQVLSK